MSKFKYQPRSADTVEKRIADRGGDYDQYLKVDPIKVAEGSNAFRILPPSWDTKGEWGDNWCIDAWLHWDVGADKGTYLCLNKMKGEDCPICEMVADVNDDELAKKLKAKRSLFAYVIDRKNEKAGPQVWRLGKQLEGNLHFRSKDKKTGAILAIDHPERGYDISFTRVGTDEKTKYTNEDVDRDMSFLSENEKTENKWLDYIVEHPLPEQLNYYSYEHMAKVIKGRKSAKTNDDDPPSRSRRASTEPDEEPDTRRRAATAEDEPAPRRSSREPEAENDTGGGRSRQRPRAEEEDPPARSRVRQTPVEEDEIPSERPRRAAPKADADEGEEEPEDEGTTSRAKASLKRLQPK